MEHILRCGAQKQIDNFIYENGEKTAHAQKMVNFPLITRWYIFLRFVVDSI